MALIWWTLAGVGAVIALSGTWPAASQRPFGLPLSKITLPPKRKLIGALAGAAVLGALTGWAVAIVGGLLIGYHADRLIVGERVASEQQRERTRAVGIWIDQLRNSLAASHGLEKAITVTAPYAPAAVRPHVERLRARAEELGLAEALVLAADDFDDQSADAAIVGLIIAARGGASRVSASLSSIADATRERVAMQLETEADRASSRTAIRIIVGFCVGLLVLLSVIAREYLEPFGSAEGQAVLGLVVALFAGAFFWIGRIYRVPVPDRLIGAGAIATWNLEDDL